MTDLNTELTKELSTYFPQYEEKLNSFPSRKLLDSDLCARGVISETELVTAYSKATGLPLIEEDDIKTPEAIPELPIDFLMFRTCLPFKKNKNTVDIAVSHPYDIEEIRYTINNLHSLDSNFFLARRTHIERILQSEFLDKDAAQEEDAEVTFTGEMDSEEALRTLASEAKIVRLVNDMFSRAVEMEASDIHVEPDEKKLSVRFRVDGKLYEVMTPSLSLYPAIASRIKLIGGLNIAERRLPQDGRTDLQIGKILIDVRISTIPTMNGESIVLRVLNKSSVIFDLKNIGMGDKIRSDFEKLIRLPYGMILVVGPTGSGKSTTIYSVINKINSAERKIITIEDPVEYRTEGIQQIQVNDKIGLNFASGLRHVVRQDPDIILVGEIRDKETAEIAIHAALTGHLVFSTLHTNDAPGAVSRLLDMGIENFLVSSSLSGVISQRLVRRICPKCNGTGKIESGTKCKNCNGRGFKGRIGIFELMTVNDEIRDCINRGDDSSKIAQVAIKNGMRPLVDDGMEKVKQGVTTETEVAGVSFDTLG